MNRIITAACAILVGVSAAYGWLGQIAGSFPAPGGSYAFGMASSPGYLYCLVGSNPRRVYKCSINNGSVYSSWGAIFARDPRGVAYSEGGHLWVGCTSYDYVFDCNESSGSIYRSWDSGYDPFGLAPECTGDGGVGTTALLATDGDPAYCWRRNLTTGSIYSSFPMNPATGTDIAWDHRNRLVWASRTPNIIGFSPTGSICASFPAPGEGFPYGMTYYGSYLYLCTWQDRLIYKVHIPRALSIYPASLGRTKALFY